MIINKFNVKKAVTATSNALYFDTFDTFSKNYLFNLKFSHHVQKKRFISKKIFILADIYNNNI